MIEGLLIVLEGVDGAGTTTHSRLLEKMFNERGLPVHVTHEPSGGPVGVMVRQILSGRLVVPGISGGRPPTWTTMALLFAADRLDHLEAEIVPNLMDGVTVISDRYYHSSIAYQALSGGGEPEMLNWVREINRHARRPDLTIVLDVPPKVAACRRQERSRGPEMYDDDELQQKLTSFYGDIEVHFPNENIVHVNSDRPLEMVAADVLNHVRRLRNE